MSRRSSLLIALCIAGTTRASRGNEPGASSPAEESVYGYVGRVPDSLLPDSGGVRDHDSFVGWYRYPEQPPGWEEMEIGPDGNPTAYTHDLAVAGVTVIHRVADGDIWTAEADLPNGQHLSWPGVTWYASYEGQNNCFVGWDGGTWVQCGLTSITITWYTEAKCEPPGEWTMTFNEGCLGGCPDVPYHSGVFILLPETPLTVPLYPQCGSWGADHYDHWCGMYDDAGQHLSNHTCDGRSGETEHILCHKGCFLTAVAMVLSHHGAAVTPDVLNTWLSSQSDGFVEGRVNVWAAVRYARQNGVQIQYLGKGPAGSESTLRQYLCLYGPQMIGQVGTPGLPNSHWLVAYGETEDQSAFLVNDPGTGSRRLLSEWGSCNAGSFCDMHVFKGPEPPGQRTAIVQTGMICLVNGSDPVELLLIDPQGRQTGFDPIAGLAYDQIPWSAYAEHGQDSHDPAGGDDVVKEIEVRGPIAGQYTLKVIATGEGTYMLHVLGYDAEVNASRATLEPVPVSAGSIHTIQLNFDGSTGSQIVVTPDCPFTCGDSDGDQAVDLRDFARFQACMGATAIGSVACACADRDRNGVIDGTDYARLANGLGLEAPPSEMAGSTCTDGLDNDCDGLSDCADAEDCLGDPPCWSCGNSVCDPDEDCTACAEDCPGVDHGPPSGRFCCGNGVLETAEGDGSLCDGNP